MSYKVSVILPIFNGEKTLARTLDSLVNQTFQDIELIACIDGSNDNSSNILNDYKNLKALNLKCMNIKTFTDFSQRNVLNLQRLEYFSGFPFTVHQKLIFFQKLIFIPTRLFFKKINPFLAKHPSRFYSSSLIAIYNNEK